jgi:hypothetical protein
MALSVETWALIEQEFARAIFWSHAWGKLRSWRGPHPLEKMPPHERRRDEQRYARIQSHTRRADCRFATCPRQTIPIHP